MNTVVMLPLWQWLCYVAAVVAIIGPSVAVPSAIFEARYGARLAVQLCARQWECPMAKSRESSEWKESLEQKLATFEATHSVEAMRKASEAALKESDPNLTAVPEKG